MPEEPQGIVPKRRAIALLVGVALAVLVLLAAELVARGAAPPADEGGILVDGDAELRSGLLQPDAARAYALAPHYRATRKHAGSFALDAWPWRGRPATPAPGDIRRVIVVGDSCVYGVGLDVAESLPELLATELDARGHGRDTLQVLNLGVPGYSTLQVERVVEWALDELAPEAVVIYAAAWNDGSPALRKPDREVLRGPSWWTRSALARWLAGRARPALPTHEVVERWEAGDAPYGPRVAPDEVAETLARITRTARSAGCEPVFLAPAHPARTNAKHARVAIDRAAVRDAARSTGSTLIDVPAIAATTGLADAALFTDFVHPSPLLFGAVAPPVADALAEILTPAGTRGSDWSPAASPSEVSALGDVEIAVDLDRWDGWRAGETTPRAIVGGAPLLDPRIEGTRLIGTVLRNSPGEHPLVLQSERAVAVAPAAITFRAPRLEVEDGALIFRSRPGDTASVVLGSTLLEEPDYGLNGPGWIADAGRFPHAFPIAAGPDGVGRLELPDDADQGPLYAQALVLPAGCAPESGEARMTAPIQLFQ